MCAVLDIAFCFGSFMSYFTAVLLRHFLDYFEVVPVSPVFTGFTIIFRLHMRCSSVVRTLYFKIFSAYFLWSSGQSFWLQIQRSRVRFPALPDFLSSSGSGTGSTQPREFN